MKAILIGNRERFEKFYPNTEFANAVEKIYLTMEEVNQALSGLSGGEIQDALFLAADAIAKVPESLIAQLPDLRIIHSEGVGYNGIDCAAAAKRGIYVCNNRGVNADAVAEQTILLMLGLLRNVTAGDRAVRAGEQIQRKESMMVNGITELGECRIGLIGFGDIAKAVAKRLEPFGCEVFYNATHRKSTGEEAEYHVTWMERQEMIAACDIISIHVPVTPDTVGMVDEAFLRAMRPNALLINTARGEMVDNEALGRALNEGWIAGAGLDTVAPEPVAADHPLLGLSAEAESRLLFSPHIGGVTTGVFRKGHRNIWTAFERVSRGERPANVVNGL
ncbi:MAG: NAD(P)-binding domain-containing protein [Clostridiales bacterium]|nr:NAD(P)-binding domain-containing protein [Clostridiales bacterium]